MLCRMKMQIFSGHQILTFNTSNPRVKRWCLLMEELDHDLQYVSKKNNAISDDMPRAQCAMRKIH